LHVYRRSVHDHCSFDRFYYNGEAAMKPLFIKINVTGAYRAIKGFLFNLTAMGKEVKKVQAEINNSKEKEQER
jgi:hypothetical protein